MTAVFVVSHKLSDISVTDNSNDVIIKAVFYRERSILIMKMKFFVPVLAAVMLTASCGVSVESDPATEKQSAKTTADNREVSDNESIPDGQSHEDTDSQSPETEKPQETRTGKTVVRFACAGDNLIHDNIYLEAQNDDGSYDFSKCYAPCKKLIEDTDVAVLNQETLVNDMFEPSTFPLFSTPTEDGDAVVDFGFNVISMSNNHVLDKGSDGLIASLDYWDTKDVVHYGAYRDEADAENIRTMEVNGITFAFLGYMEHTNGFFLSDDEPGEVVYIEERERIERQVRAADEMADVVVVSCHFGTEVQNDLNAMQMEFAPQLVEWGADLIIGTQAHALSTCGFIDKPDGGRAFVYYGLGNFLNTMYDADNPDGWYGRAILGIFGKLDIVKDFDNGGAVTFENVKAIPVISHYEGVSWDSMWYNCAVYPYGDYTDEMFSRHMMYQQVGVNRDTLAHYLSYIPEEFLAYE